MIVLFFSMQANMLFVSSLDAFAQHRNVLSFPFLTNTSKSIIPPEAFVNTKISDSKIQSGGIFEANWTYSLVE